jgi:hypothetical protein
MKRTHSFEIVGIGEFDEYPAKVKKKEYPSVNKSGVALVKKVIAQGNPSEYGYLDSMGKVYAKEEVFFDLNGKLVQKVGRTEKVSPQNYKIVEQKEVSDLLDNISKSFVLPKNETTMKAFKGLVAQDKALKFKYKKSSVGLNWVDSFMFEKDGVLMLYSGEGKESEAVEKFKALQNAVKQNKDIVTDEIVVSNADDVAPQLD